VLGILQVDSLAQEEVLVPHQDLMPQPLEETDSPTHIHTHMPQPMHVVETDSLLHIQTHMHPMGKRKKTNRQTTIYKTLHRKLKIEQHEPYYE
jgi:hypothetical protein